jgi:hypothetical protein
MERRRFLQGVAAAFVGVSGRRIITLDEDAEAALVVKATAADVAAFGRGGLVTVASGHGTYPAGQAQPAMASSVYLFNQDGQPVVELTEIHRPHFERLRFDASSSSDTDADVFVMGVPRRQRIAVTVEILHSATVGGMESPAMRLMRQIPSFPSSP